MTIHIVNIGFVNIGCMNIGFVNAGFVHIGFVNIGFVNIGFVNIGFVNMGFVNIGFVCIGFEKHGLLLSQYGRPIKREACPLPGSWINHVGRCQGPPKILSRGEVDDDLRGIRAQLTSYNKVQETKYRTTRYRIPNTVGCPQDQQSLYGKGIGNRIRAPAWGTQGMFYTCSI